MSLKNYPVFSHPMILLTPGKQGQVSQILPAFSTMSASLIQDVLCISGFSCSWGVLNTKRCRCTRTRERKKPRGNCLKNVGVVQFIQQSEALISCCNGMWRHGIKPLQMPKGALLLTPAESIGLGFYLWPWSRMFCSPPAQEIKGLRRHPSSSMVYTHFSHQTFFKKNCAHGEFSICLFSFP